MSSAFLVDAFHNTANAWSFEAPKVKQNIWPCSDLKANDNKRRPTWTKRSLKISQCSYPSTPAVSSPGHQGRLLEQSLSSLGTSIFQTHRFGEGLLSSGPFLTSNSRFLSSSMQQQLPAVMQIALAVACLAYFPQTIASSWIQQRDVDQSWVNQPTGFFRRGYHASLFIFPLQDPGLSNSAQAWFLGTIFT